jgi:hypothetical protein
MLLLNIIAMNIIDVACAYFSANGNSKFSCRSFKSSCVAACFCRRRRRHSQNFPRMICSKGYAIAFVTIVLLISAPTLSYHENVVSVYSPWNRYGTYASSVTDAYTMMGMSAELTTSERNSLYAIAF